MLKILALSLLAGLAAGLNWIDRRDCVEINIYGYRHHAYCPDSYAAVGLCSSGRHRDCWGANGRLKCCKVIGKQHPKRQCDYSAARCGKGIKCHGDKVITAMCTSLGGPDCGHGAWTRMHCCDDRGLKLDRGRCRWRGAKYGWLQQCQGDEVMVGACTSGRNADCGKKTWTGINCCRIRGGRSLRKGLDPVPDNFDQIDEFDETNAIKSPTILSDDSDDKEQIPAEEKESFSEETEE